MRERPHKKKAGSREQHFCHQRDLRAAWVAYWRAWLAHCHANPGRTDFPPMPAHLGDLCCGALTRAGTPCQRRDLYWSGRCRLHGGLSTGPVTQVGKAQARVNGTKGGRPPHEKPNPMKGVTKNHGLPASATRQVSVGSAAGVTAAAVATTTLISEQDERKSGAASAAGQTSVRCLSCQHMSAGLTCLLDPQKQGALPYWAWRACSSYEASVSVFSSASE